jgi:hypothetical protein
VTAARQEGISKFVDEVFDSAYNETQLAGDLPHIRWGRIDYLNVSIITTKWGIWQYVFLYFEYHVLETDDMTSELRTWSYLRTAEKHYASSKLTSYGSKLKC